MGTVYICWKFAFSLRLILYIFVRQIEQSEGQSNSSYLSAINWSGPYYTLLTVSK